MKAHARLIASACLVTLAAAPSAQVVQAPFNTDYTLTDLGSVPGLPTNYGGLTFDPNDANILLIGGAANTAAGILYEIAVVRDAMNHVTGFSGSATQRATAAFNDGGVVIGPGNVMFLARWPANELGQYLPGSTAPDKITNMAALGVAQSLAALAFVPQGFPGAGSMKLVSWSVGSWYTSTYTPDGAGTYNIGPVTPGPTLPGGPEGIIYVPAGSPQFPDFTSMLVCEFSAGTVVAYTVDANGDPIIATRVPFVTGLSGAEGAVFDPLTGDFLFSTFGGGSKVVRVQGFATPCDAMLTEYGSGLAGSGGFEPKLGTNGCAAPGDSFVLEITEGIGGGSGCLALSAASAAVPLAGGTQLVSYPFTNVYSQTLGGAPGLAGDGTASIPFMVPNDTSLTGLSFFAQAGFVDPGAPMGISLTKGLEVTIGS